VAYHGAVKKQRVRAPLAVFLGRLHSGRPCLSPLYFTYKYIGGEHKRRDKKKRKKAVKKKKKN
jgi:hypothetical protein